MRPALAREPAAEVTGHSWRKESLRIVESPCGGAMARGFTESEKPLPALVSRAGGGIVQWKFGFAV